MVNPLLNYLKTDRNNFEDVGYYRFNIANETPALSANVRYFNEFEWADEYLTYCHRSEAFAERWKAALGDWTGKVIVDIGCGPGNIFATIKGAPALLIGVDVAPESLKLAKKQNYTPVLADANDLPFQSGFADIVTLNAALHHCEDMEAVLKEAARLVKPGGLLVTDHDPQKSAWDYKGLAKLMWNLRLYYYRFTNYGFHKTKNQQYWALACEIHHKPGHGVTEKLFNDVLYLLGFKVNIYPHNHTEGAAVLKGKTGPLDLKYKLGALLSGCNPSANKSCLSLMCIAQRQV
jgi:ubiquinone/menaquinone biosynthesis C-methylase UbiE